MASPGLRLQAAPPLALTAPRRHLGAMGTLVPLPRAPSRLSCARRARTRRAVPPCRAFLKGGAWWKDAKPPNCADVDSVQQFVDELAAHPEQLVVVEFYATWCSGCRSLAPQLARLAAKRPGVRFLYVDADANRALARKLAVDGLPTVLLFAGAEGCVQQFNVTAARVHLLEAAIERWGAPRCSLGDVPPLRGFPSVRPRAAALARAQEQPRAHAVA